MYPAGCTNDVARYNEGLPKILKEVLLLCGMHARKDFNLII